MNKLVILLFGITIIGICYSASTDPCQGPDATDEPKDCVKRTDIRYKDYNIDCCWVTYKTKTSDTPPSTVTKKCEYIGTLGDGAKSKQIEYETQKGYTDVSVICASSYLAFTFIALLSLLI